MLFLTVGLKFNSSLKYSLHFLYFGTHLHQFLLDILMIVNISGPKLYTLSLPKPRLYSYRLGRHSVHFLPKHSLIVRFFVDVQKSRSTKINMCRERGGGVEIWTISTDQLTKNCKIGKINLPRRIFNFIAKDVIIMTSAAAMYEM